MQYMGGKNACYRQIINLIPPHRRYIETHLGSGAILRHKLPARGSIAIDVDASCTAAVIAEMSDSLEVIAGNSEHSGVIAMGSDASCTFINDNCLFWLRDNPHLLTKDTFIYADPPYVMSARSSQRKYYKHEYSDADHRALLRLLKRLPCVVMISGYWSEMYEQELQDWHTATFTAQTRNGPATEWLWMNYPEPIELHDYRYLGSDFRERERIKRKSKRWVKRFDSLPLLEKQRIIGDLRDEGVLQQR